MKRIYYLAPSVASAVDINRDLHAVGVGDNRIHVMGKNRGELEQAQLPTTSVWEETDIMHSGFVYAFGGGCTGLVIGFLLSGMDPWGMQLDIGVIIASTLFFGCFGAWFGGILGISSRNHHLAPYLSKVEQGGEFLVMVDAEDKNMQKNIDQVMSARHREAREAGHEDHYSPFF